MRGHRAQSPPAPKSVVVCGPMARNRPKPDRRRALKYLHPIYALGVRGIGGERVCANGRTVEVARVRITEAGRKALAGP